MKRAGCVARVSRSEGAIRRIGRLYEELALMPIDSGKRRALSAAIRIEADAYRKSLDAEQASAMHDARPALPLMPRPRKTS